MRGESEEARGGVGGKRPSNARCVPMRVQGPLLVGAGREKGKESCEHAERRGWRATENGEPAGANAAFGSFFFFQSRRASCRVQNQ